MKIFKYRFEYLVKNISLMFFSLVSINSYSAVDCNQVKSAIIAMSNAYSDTNGPSIQSYNIESAENINTLWAETIENNIEKFNTLVDVAYYSEKASDCRLNILRDSIRLEVGVIGEVFEDSDSDSESSAHLFSSALFPALFVKKTKSQSIGDFTVQAEFDWAIHSDDDGLVFNENEFYGNLGIYLPLGPFHAYYNPYKLPKKSMSLNLEVENSEIENTQKTLTVNYQFYDVVNENGDNRLWNIGGGKVFDDDDGYIFNFGVENRILSDNIDKKINKEHIFPRIDFTYFEPDSSEIEHNSIITAQYIYRRKSSKLLWKELPISNKFILEFSLGKSFELNDSLDNDSLFGFISLSIENLDLGDAGSGSGGRSRGRRVRP